MKQKLRKGLSLTLFLLGLMIFSTSPMNITGAVIGTPQITSGIVSLIGIVVMFAALMVFTTGTITDTKKDEKLEEILSNEDFKFFEKFVKKGDFKNIKSDDKELRRFYEDVFFEYNLIKEELGSMEARHRLAEIFKNIEENYTKENIRLNDLITRAIDFDFNTKFDSLNIENSDYDFLKKRMEQMEQGNFVPEKYTIFDTNILIDAKKNKTDFKKLKNIFNKPVSGNNIFNKPVSGNNMSDVPVIIPVKVDEEFNDKDGKNNALKGLSDSDKQIIIDRDKTINKDISIKGNVFSEDWVEDASNYLLAKVFDKYLGNNSIDFDEVIDAEYKAISNLLGKSYSIKVDKDDVKKRTLDFIKEYDSLSSSKFTNNKKPVKLMKEYERAQRSIVFNYERRLKCLRDAKDILTLTPKYFAGEYLEQKYDENGALRNSNLTPESLVKTFAARINASPFEEQDIIDEIRKKEKDYFKTKASDGGSKARKFRSQAILSDADIAVLANGLFLQGRNLEDIRASFSTGDVNEVVIYSNDAHLADAQTVYNAHLSYGGSNPNLRDKLKIKRTL